MLHNLIQIIWNGWNIKAPSISTYNGYHHNLIVRRKTLDLYFKWRAVSVAKKKYIYIYENIEKGDAILLLRVCVCVCMCMFVRFCFLLWGNIESVKMYREGLNIKWPGQKKLYSLTLRSFRKSAVCSVMFCEFISDEKHDVIISPSYRLLQQLSYKILNINSKYAKK